MVLAEDFMKIRIRSATTIGRPATSGASLDHSERLVFMVACVIIAFLYGIVVGSIVGFLAGFLIAVLSIIPPSIFEAPTNRDQHRSGSGDGHSSGR